MIANSALKQHLESLGLTNLGTVHQNCSPAELVEFALTRGEGQLTSTGALRVETGQYTGRSPNDRFVVQEGASADRVAWGKTNKPISPDNFDKCLHRVREHLHGRDLFVQDCYAGADPENRLRIRVVSERAWNALFAHQLFIPIDPADAHGHDPQFTVLHAPSCEGDPKQDGINSAAFVLLALERGLVVIGGTKYAGEIKKSIFSVMNYVLPQRGVMGMHCSANIGDDGETALFFGLSGTGKTTLSADPDRGLIGDDEHGWGPNGIFNFEGGCYAKCIDLTPESEPEIYHAIRFGSVVENVVIDESTRVADYHDSTLAENTRCAYPVQYISNHVPSGRGGHPSHILFLTYDAFGVLPPVSRLTSEQAMYHFMSGYTSKVAGTERGITEPQTTFSACYGEPFLPLHPSEYARMLGERIEKYGSSCWLINTGFSGGAYGVGRRMSLKHTRAIVTAALNGDLSGVPTSEHPVFKVSVPTSCPGVPSEILDPRETWADKDAYDAAASRLAEEFQRNFERFEGVDSLILEAAPVPA